MTTSRRFVWTIYSLDKRVALATSSHGVPMEINELELPEGLKDLLDV